MSVPPRPVPGRQYCVYLLVTLVLGPAATVTAETGKNSYMLECQGCHGIDGSGLAESVPALKDTMARFLLIPGGREYLVQVPGSAQSPLSDQELTDTLNWMLSEFGPTDIADRFPKYKAENVSRWRKTPLIDVRAEREKLIQAKGTIDAPLVN